MATLAPFTTPFPGVAAASGRDLLWEHCRNNLGIARLLVHERRPDALVATACRMAEETAVRAALGEAAGGDVEAALSRFGVDVVSGTALERLWAAEKTVGRVAAYLRQEAPERTWGF